MYIDDVTVLLWNNALMFLQTVTSSVLHKFIIIRRPFLCLFLAQAFTWRQFIGEQEQNATD